MSNLPSHLFDGAVLRLRGPYPPLVEVVQRDEERGAEGSHGGGQGDGDVPEENHRWRVRWRREPGTGAGRTAAACSWTPTARLTSSFLAAQRSCCGCVRYM